MKALADPIRHLDRGIYDVPEVARLVHADPSTVARWTTRQGPRSALVEPEEPGVLSFHDLISVYVIHELRSRHVRLSDIENGAAYLGRKLRTSRPFAHKKLATVGKSFFANVEDWVDAGQSGQMAFQEIIKPLMRPIRFGRDELASLWYPHEHVWINPLVQAGTPCIRGTRVPTATVAAMASEGAEAVADDLGLELIQVMAAISYERTLEAA